MRRHTLDRPLLSGGKQSLLNGILTGIKIPKTPHNRPKNLRRTLTQQILEAGRRAQNSQPLMSRIGRTSTWVKAASGTLAAQPTASSRSSQSIR